MKWIPKYMVIGLLICLNSQANAFDPCTDIITHKPRADVNHNASPVQVPEHIQIPLTIDMAERYGIERLPEGSELNAEIGVIEIDQHGGIFYNGENISGDIKDKCDNESGEFKDIIEQQAEDGDNTDTGRKLP